VCDFFLHSPIGLFDGSTGINEDMFIKTPLHRSLSS
jgi:hypothetical protein